MCGQMDSPVERSSQSLGASRCGVLRRWVDTTSSLELEKSRYFQSSARSPRFLFQGKLSVTTEYTQHVISPLSIANELITVRPLLLDHWRAIHFNFRKIVHDLSFSHSRPLITICLDSPLSNNASTSPFTRSGKTPVTTPPHFWIFSSLSNKLSKAIV